MEFDGYGRVYRDKFGDAYKFIYSIKALNKAMTKKYGNDWRFNSTIITTYGKEQLGIEGL